MRRPLAPADAILECLRWHGLFYKPGVELDTWEAACPCCEPMLVTLRIREHGRGGPLSLRCRSGCLESDIVRILKADPAELRVRSAVGLAEDTSGIARLALEHCRRQARQIATLEHIIEAGLRAAA